MSTPETVAEAPPRAVDPAALRGLMGLFGTGVTVITFRRGSVVHGATVNAFTSVSLDPPLVLVALDRRSRTAALLDDGGYVINILGERQREVALHFAGRPMAREVPWRDEAGAYPRLEGTVGHLVCRPWRTYEGGDHTLHVARVEDVAAPGGRPLLFFRGAFPRLAADHSPSAWSLSLDGPGPAEQFVMRHETRK
ncbi:flavin reductase family protein [Streptomyces purpureus]|uniref:Flavin oxidoreductase n=1 Tax=Streptomyces purpureus TaxID=1951 RepID=A0A918H0C2_9ACTN|nr:flavin reductase family protein [Streptomyces purpureus]GGT29190.1 flavin oxidoreductase [Streptomyces purpureus]